MSISFNTESSISTAAARAVVLPRLQEWFGLSQDANILSDVDVTRASSGGAVVTIRLGTLVGREEWAELEKALREYEEED